MKPAHLHINNFEKPFVLFMGPQRTGTTWLHRYLEPHKEVCVPQDVKEVRFSDREYDNGAGYYRGHFVPNTDTKIFAEVSTTAFDHCDAPHRVYEVFGKDIKLVRPLRHPITRSYSLYRHYLRYAKASGSLKEACAQKPRILTSSYYAEHLQRWFDVFPRACFHFTFYEDFAADQECYIRRMCEILSITHASISSEQACAVNAATSSRIHALAYVTQNAADWLRHNQCYKVINLAKRLGFKNLIFGEDDMSENNIDISAQDKQWLDDQLGGEVEKIERLIGPISQWRSK